MINCQSIVDVNLRYFNLIASVEEKIKVKKNVFSR